MTSDDYEQAATTQQLPKPTLSSVDLATGSLKQAFHPRHHSTLPPWPLYPSVEDSDKRAGDAGSWYDCLLYPYGSDNNNDKNGDDDNDNNNEDPTFNAISSCLPITNVSVPNP